MLAYLLNHPLVVIYLLYLVCMLPFLMWTSSHGPQRRLPRNKPWQDAEAEERTFPGAHRPWPEIANTNGTKKKKL